MGAVSRKRAQYIGLPMKKKFNYNPGPDEPYGRIGKVPTRSRALNRGSIERA
jgi:hypothetical protein